MSLASNYDQKVRIIDDILAKMSLDEKKIFLRKMIKADMKLFFQTIFDEQHSLEKEAGIEGACLLEDTSEKVWFNGEEIDIESVRPENIGRVPKTEENVWYLDEKKTGNDRHDGFLGYVSDEPKPEEEPNV